MKIEATSKLYRPLKKEFDGGFPKINLGSPFGSFPFDINPPGVDVQGVEQRAERCVERDTNDQQELAELGERTPGTHSQDAVKTKKSVVSKKSRYGNGVNVD